eukprot:6472742-Amphidinium_carterae.1
MPGAVALPVVSAQQLLQPKDGGYKWIRFSNSQEDRSQRLAAAVLTLQACRAGGYTLDSSKPDVRLKHLSEVVEGTRFITSRHVNSSGADVSKKLPRVLIAEETTALEAAVARASATQ